MLKKPSPKNLEVVDVPADNPVGTMHRFGDGLRKVLAASKPPARRYGVGRRTSKRKR